MTELPRGHFSGRTVSGTRQPDALRTGWRTTLRQGMQLKRRSTGGKYCGPCQAGPGVQEHEIQYRREKQTTARQNQTDTRVQAQLQTCTFPMTRWCHGRQTTIAHDGRGQAATKRLGEGQKW
ncbi:unnamed protein product [Protopolystoma xenopodis]|uniref:Uncharacterized protein n=1 Tax=Protopolystoma xenopodis TaxID=117903 RepID=A0A3S5AHT8_9PLAT|nr:unnamed protein product [Protopolystoma xenopodis]